MHPRCPPHGRQEIRIHMNRFTQNIIAIVYDFDGTLTPQPMQEYTVLPKIGMSARRFWQEVDEEVVRESADPMLTYMRLMVERIEQARQHLSPQDLCALAPRIDYFPGVDEWFGRINDYIGEHSQGSVKVEHFIISAGLREILEGTRIRDHFSRIYASEYFFDHHGVATFPKVVINDTNKTQYLFRINKGREEISETINEYMPEAERRIPFANMLYIGDGLTDVPCMTVTKKNGGFAIAVHKPRNNKTIGVCRKLLRADRVDYYAPADYRPGSLLDRRVRLILDLIIARIHLARETFACRRDLPPGD